MVHYSTTSLEARIGGFFFGLVFAGLGLMFGWGGGYWAKIPLGTQRDQFASVEGHLTRLDPAVRHAGRYDVWFTARGEYQFTVSGERYEGSRMGIFGASHLREMDERALRNAYEAGKPVVVRYDTANPKDNYLEITEGDADARSGAMTIGAIGGALLLVGVYGLIWAVVPRRR